MTDKGLVSKIFKQFMKLSIFFLKLSIQKKSNNPTNKKKKAKDLYRHISKDKVQMAKKHMKRCSASLIIT